MIGSLLTPGGVAHNVPGEARPTGRRREWFALTACGRRVLGEVIANAIEDDVLPCGACLRVTRSLARRRAR